MIALPETDPLAAAWITLFRRCGAAPRWRTVPVLVAGAPYPPLLHLVVWAKYVQLLAPATPAALDTAVAHASELVAFIERPLLLVLGAPQPNAFRIILVVPTAAAAPDAAPRLPVVGNRALHPLTLVTGASGFTYLWCPDASEVLAPVRPHDPAHILRPPLLPFHAPWRVTHPAHSAPQVARYQVRRTGPDFVAHDCGTANQLTLTLSGGLLIPGNPVAAHVR